MTNHTPVNSDLITASQVDLRRLSLLAALFEASPSGQSTSPSAVVDSLSISFPSLTAALSNDLAALASEGLIYTDEQSLAGPAEVAVTAQGEAMVEAIRSQVESNPDARAAAVGPLVLRYMVSEPRQAPTTRVFKDAGVPLFGLPLPEGYIEEAVFELWRLGLLQATRVDGGEVIAERITTEGRFCLRSARPVLLPANSASSTVYNTSIGSLTAQTVAVATTGNVTQTASLSLGLSELVKTVEALQDALSDHPDLQDSIDDATFQIEQAVSQGDTSMIARSLSALKRASRAAARTGVDAAIVAAVGNAVSGLMGAL